MGRRDDLRPIAASRPASDLRHRVSGSGSGLVHRSSVSGVRHPVRVMRRMPAGPLGSATVLARSGWLTAVVLAPRPAPGEPVEMDPDHEARAIREVNDRLRARFPDLDPAVVEAAVRVAHAEITGPVREFVPLLVERAARRRLSFAEPGLSDEAHDAEHGAGPAVGEPAPAAVGDPLDSAN